MLTKPVGSNCYTYDLPFELESGAKLPGLSIAYHTYGKLNEDKSNVVWVCHALTANSDVCDWWNGLFGEGFLFDPEKYFIVCANNLGSCYGSSGPQEADINGNKLYHEFPLVTIRDMVKAHRLLAAHLGIDSIALLIGGSQGGQQAIEWSIDAPEQIEKLVAIATNAKHSPWGIAFNESQRLALVSDPDYYTKSSTSGSKGLIAARSIAMLSYRSYVTYNESQQDEHNDNVDAFKASSYQQYQGAKLSKRFNAHSYYTLSKAMDSHNVGRARTSIADSLSAIKAKTLVVGVSSDLLFPIAEQKYLAAAIPNATYAEIDSIYGHDGFLVETKALSEVISGFISN